MVPGSRHLVLWLGGITPIIVGLTVVELTREHRGASASRMPTAVPALRAGLSDGMASATASAAIVTTIAPSGVPEGATYQNDWRVSLWEVVFDIDDVVEIRTPKGPVRVTTRFDGMRYFVGPLPDMLVAPAPHIWGTFTHTIHGEGQARVVSKSGSRPVLPVSADDPTARELLVGRSVKLCDPAISVQTEGARRYSWPSPNTFVISNNVVWPKTEMTYYGESGNRLSSVPVDSGQPLYTVPEQEVPYDYRELINRGTAKLPPFLGLGGLRQISRMLKYTIVRNHTMKLEFLRHCPEGKRPTQNPPECVPNLVGNSTLVACTGCTTVTDYYAYYGTDFFFIHPNVEVRLKIGNEDVNIASRRNRNGQLKYFEPVRLRRAWESGLRSNDDGDGVYRRVTLGTNGWIDDETGVAETGAVAEPNWRDMPAPGESRQPPAWPRKRVVQEFLLGVKDFPEFGFLYYATLVDTKPGGYRVQKSNAERITAEEWCRIKQSPRPRWSGLNPLDDSGWRQAPPITP